MCRRNRKRKRENNARCAHVTNLYFYANYHAVVVEVVDENGHVKNFRLALVLKKIFFILFSTTSRKFKKIIFLLVKIYNQN